MNEPVIFQPERVFRMGSIELADPAPEASPEDALRLYIPNYPHLQNAQLGEPIIEEDRLVYPIEKPEVQTKGADNSIELLVINELECLNLPLGEQSSVRTAQ